MNLVRLGIIGLGNIGRHHAATVLESRVARCQLAAVCTRTTELPSSFKSIARFTDAGELIRSGLVDAVLIATPHPSHAALGAAAFERGLHVLVEKPIAAHKAEAERFIAAHQASPGCVFAIMLQFRAQPGFQEMRQLIRGGALGAIVRVCWISTDWFRPEAYYASSEWRATWGGEGGGVLINQCLHHLDLLQWLVGMPASVRASCQFGRFHDIEVEDDVTAYLEWANGATGVFVGSTGEVPGTNRLEIVGTRGRLVLEEGRLLFSQNERDAAELCLALDQPFARPNFRTEEIPFASELHPHAVLLQNFIAAILDGETLIAPGADGLASLELANAMVYSSLRGETLPLPLDGAAWEVKLNELAAASRVKKVVRPVPGSVADSFRQ
jgi:predicted dehydrogenase